jgi:hypothetical protein
MTDEVFDKKILENKIIEALDLKNKYERGFLLMKQALLYGIVGFLMVLAPLLFPIATTTPDIIHKALLINTWVGTFLLISGFVLATISIPSTGKWVIEKKRLRLLYKMLNKEEGKGLFESGHTIDIDKANSVLVKKAFLFYVRGMLLVLVPLTILYLESPRTQIHLFMGSLGVLIAGLILAIVTISDLRSSRKHLRLCYSMFKKK